MGFFFVWANEGYARQQQKKQTNKSGNKINRKRDRKNGVSSFGFLFCCILFGASYRQQNRGGGGVGGRGGFWGVGNYCNTLGLGGGGGLNENRG